MSYYFACELISLWWKSATLPCSASGGRPAQGVHVTSGLGVDALSLERLQKIISITLHSTRLPLRSELTFPPPERSSIRKSPSSTPMPLSLHLYDRQVACKESGGKWLMRSGGPHLFCLAPRGHRALCCSDVRPPTPELCMATDVGCDRRCGVGPVCPKAMVAGTGTS